MDRDSRIILREWAANGGPPVSVLYAAVQHMNREELQRLKASCDLEFKARAMTWRIGDKIVPIRELDDAHLDLIVEEGLENLTIDRQMLAILKYENSLRKL